MSFMTKRKTKTISVRAKIEAIERFKARCLELGTNANKVLADVIEAPAVTVKPAPAPKAAAQRKPKKPAIADKPIGFDAATGEPIFKRGVGPQKGKK